MKTTEESSTNQACTRRKTTSPKFDALLCHKSPFSFIALIYFGLVKHISCSWLMISLKSVLKTHTSHKFSVALVLLFSREIWSVNPPELNSSPHSFHVCCLLSLGVLIDFTVNPKLQFYGLFSTGFPTGIQIWRHSSSYKHSSLIKQGTGFSSINIKKIKGKLYLTSVFELGCSTDTVLKTTGYDASAFTSGIVILEEKTSVNAMKATWIINGVQAQELSAEKTLLLEEQLTFQILHSLTNLLRKSAPDCHWN